MNNTTKIIIGVFAALISIMFVCMCIGFFTLRGVSTAIDQSLVDDPAEVARLARDIIDYDLPPGYQEQAYMDIFVGQIVMIDKRSDAGDKPEKLIMFMQLSSVLGLSEEEAKVEIQSSMEQQMQQGDFSLEFVSQTETTIRDQSVTLSTYEGTDDSGTPIRQIISDAFQGKDGYTMLIILGDIASWNQAEIDAFIRSIR